MIRSNPIQQSRQGGIEMRLQAGEKVVMTLEIRAEIPTLNKVINIERRNRYAAAKLKATTETNIIRSLTRAVHTSIPEAAYPLHMSYHWHRKDKRTDPSNVAFGIKYIEDALQRAGLLDNDGPKQIQSITHTYDYGAKNDWVELTIYSESPSVVDQDHPITPSGAKWTPTETPIGSAIVPDLDTGKNAAISMQ